MSADKQNFIATVLETVDKNGFSKLSFSKPKPSCEYQKAVVSPYTQGNVKSFKIERFTKTQNFTSSASQQDLKIHIDLLLQDFFFADMIALHNIVSLKSSAKGKVTITKSSRPHNSSKTNQSGHNKLKNYFIDPSLPWLVDLDLVTKTGEVKSSMYHKFKQINRFVEIIDHHVDLTSMVEPKVIDMGCGKGYLTTALHYYMVNKVGRAFTKGYDLKNSVVENASKLAEKYKMSGLSFECQDILETNIQNVDILIALHACDTATDLAIAKGIEANASYIILSPCCHKQIRREISKTDEITKFGIYEERMAEMITDTIRSLILNKHGYQTQILEYISSEHTSKNTMIIAKKTLKADRDTDEKIKSIKDKYGIKVHYLESLLNP